VAYLRETADERVLVVLARTSWSGAVLPRHLADHEPEVLYGASGLIVDDEGIVVPGEGPSVGVWRLA